MHTSHSSRIVVIRGLKLYCGDIELKVSNIEGDFDLVGKDIVLSRGRSVCREDNKRSPSDRKVC